MKENGKEMGKEKGKRKKNQQEQKQTQNVCNRKIFYDDFWNYHKTGKRKVHQLRIDLEKPQNSTTPENFKEQLQTEPDKTENTAKVKMKVGNSNK